MYGKENSLKNKTKRIVTAKTKMKRNMHLLKRGTMIQKILKKTSATSTVPHASHTKGKDIMACCVGYISRFLIKEIRKHVGSQRGETNIAKFLPYSLYAWKTVISK
jgi:hypothetical protein